MHQYPFICVFLVYPYFVRFNTRISILNNTKDSSDNPVCTFPWQSLLLQLVFPKSHLLLIMQRESIANLLIQNHQRFTNYLQAMPDHTFVFAPTGKWSAGQQLDHLVRSVSPVVLACKLPGFLLKLLFGKPNRPGRTYDELVAKYKAKLLQGGRASGRFIPAAITPLQKQERIDALTGLVAKLAERVNLMPDEKLDGILLPHPLLGKLTLREMMYFTIYHVQHHKEGIERSLVST
jgi:hypothetical protein